MKTKTQNEFEVTITCPDCGRLVTVQNQYNPPRFTMRGGKPHTKTGCFLATKTATRKEAREAAKRAQTSMFDETVPTDAEFPAPFKLSPYVGDRE